MADQEQDVSESVQSENEIVNDKEENQEGLEGDDDDAVEEQHEDEGSYMVR